MKPRTPSIVFQRASFWRHCCLSALFLAGIAVLPVQAGSILTGYETSYTATILIDPTAGCPAKLSSQPPCFANCSAVISGPQNFQISDNAQHGGNEWLASHGEEELP